MHDVMALYKSCIFVSSCCTCVLSLIMSCENTTVCVSGPSVRQYLMFQSGVQSGWEGISCAACSQSRWPVWWSSCSGACSAEQGTWPLPADLQGEDGGARWRQGQWLQEQGWLWQLRCGWDKAVSCQGHKRVQHEGSPSGGESFISQLQWLLCPWNTTVHLHLVWQSECA